MTSWAKCRSLFCLYICVHQSSYRQSNYLLEFIWPCSCGQYFSRDELAPGFDQTPSEISGRPSLFMLERFLDVLDIGLKIKCNKLL